MEVNTEGIRAESITGRANLAGAQTLGDHGPCSEGALKSLKNAGVEGIKGQSTDIAF